MLFALLPFCLSAQTGLLSPEAYRQYIDRFNAEDKSTLKVDIPNDQAWDFLSKNIPLLDCPDRGLEETYYYRWWTFRKHLKQTPAGWVITEFLPPVGWASIYNTIPCAAGHHLREARWLKDPRYAESYARFWSLPEASPRSYSFWFANSVHALTLATGDRSLEKRLLPDLVANYRAWQKSNQSPNGLFHQIDGYDGMEYSLGGSGYRPTINSYMYGDAKAISAIAKECGENELAEDFQNQATSLKLLVQECLWNKADRFFETAKDDLQTCGIREEIGFVPWYFDLPSQRYEEAWRQLLDPEGFAAPFGPTTAEKRAEGFMHPENHDCLWNGPSWPYATTQTLVAMANLLDDYHQSVISKEDYLKQLRIYSLSQQKDGRPWVAEDLDAETGKWIVDLPRSDSYNHSGFADLIITGLVGLRPREDDELEIKPLVPPNTWDWFCLDRVPYHGQTLTILWDQSGNHYNRGQGLALFVNGRKVAHREDLGPLSTHMPSLKMKESVPTSSWKKYEPGPVLGGKLGTCFDISVLKDDGAYDMYFSWRPKASIALVRSEDGTHWSEPLVVLSPTQTGWENDINRPSVIKENGTYKMWYTGQENGHSAIGYATSQDGVHWTRREQPVLQPDQPWEKVAVMCPSVLWDSASHQYKMWYSGGDQYEPDAIGYATSTDGISWQKQPEPIFQADPGNFWESYKVTACQVIAMDGGYVMFYIGFRDIDHAQIGIARSRDGISNWQRLPSNPIISPTLGGWDADACYKPFAVYDSKGKRWMLWYNGRHGSVEQIGLATKNGLDLDFVPHNH